MDFILILKKLNKKLTAQEQKSFDDWYNASKRHRDFFEKVATNYHNNNIDLVDVEKAWFILNGKLITKDKKYFDWKYIVGIAASFLIILFLYFGKSSFIGKENSSDRNNKNITKDKLIKNKEIVLTLQDGNQVELDDKNQQTLTHGKIDNEQLVYNDKTLSDKEEIVFNYLTVPRGKFFSIKLSDGTIVWLNSDSKIKYPVAFVADQDRTVELIYGEAYFDVSPSTNHNGTTFNVLSQQQKINVLGTQFNLQAFSDEDTMVTTLVEGKIELDYSVKKQILYPNQQVIFNVKNEEINLKNVDVEDFIVWRRGEYNFKNKSLVDISKILSRWYDVDFIFESDTIKSTLFTGSLNRKQTLKDILETINKTQEIKYEIKQKKVILK